MRCLKALVVIITLMCCNLCAFAQNGFSNQGTEFYTAYIDHIDGASAADGKGSQMYLYITGDNNTMVTVEVVDGSFLQTYNVTKNNVLTVPIPSSAFIGTQGQFLKGIHITSLQPVAVYAHIFAQSVSGATLLLPVNTLGKDYLSINYTQESNSESSEKKPSYSTFDIIATEDNTSVEITPSQLLTGGQQANTPYTVTLQKGEVYQGLSLADLTGTHIRSVSNADGSCKKIAVFSGSSKIAIGCFPAKSTSDNFFQQVYPTSTWGKSYVTAPLKGRNFDVFRIVISQPNTTVYYNGVALGLSLFTAGQYYEFSSNIPGEITADKPIQVVQYAVTEGASIDCTPIKSDVGDPEMIYLTPIEQTLTHVTLYSTPEYRILSSYINVIIKTADAPTFLLDGKPYTDFLPVSGDSDYSYAQIGVDFGTHNIAASGGFNAIAYGFGDEESYGYAAGTNLNNLTEFIALENPVTGSTQLNGCTNTPYKLQLTLPYQTTDIKWVFKDGTVDEDKSPVVKSTVVKGSQTLYIYEYSKIQTYAADDYSVIATVFNPVADDCGSTEDVTFDFNITGPPAAAFDFANTCLGDTVQFTDKSTAGSNPVSAWLWDFGDGQTAIKQNPAHTFTQAGDYAVSLLVTNQNGCSTLSAQNIHISARPVAAFNFSASDCLGKDITFTDNSTTADGAIASWQWDFGDGTPIETHTTKNSFNHKFNNPGSYTVKLSVTNTNGCISNVNSQTVNVNPVPVVDFLMPDACVADNARFADKSSIADNTEADFTYLWNFGDDAHATAANPNTSADQNPVHQFTAAGVYTITLTVTSRYGCSSSMQSQFTVNGGSPKADLTVMNKNELCSNQEVFFINNSSVNFGSITRLEVTYDSADPSTLMVYDHPTPGQQLRHSYPVFAGGTRNYTVKVVAYSGVACADEADYTVVLNAAPVITLAPVKSLCPDDSPVQLSPVVTGPAGSGVFSGTGAISSTGLFDPVKSGVGTFNIRYIYTPLNNCADTVTQQITVYPSPTVDAGQDVTTLGGGQVILKPTYSGHNLSFKWTPAAGLNSDAVADPVASPAQSTVYTLTVTSAEGCSASDEINVNVLQNPVVPNAFTPNGDGINDLWEIKYLETYPNNTVDVYNRYGEKLYSSIGYSVPWDGKYKGAYVPSGTYYYIINPKNGRKVISGYVTIIR